MGERSSEDEPRPLLVEYLPSLVVAPVAVNLSQVRRKIEESPQIVTVTFAGRSICTSLWATVAAREADVREPYFGYKDSCIVRLACSEWEHDDYQSCTAAD